MILTIIISFGEIISKKKQLIINLLERFKINSWNYGKTERPTGGDFL